MPPDLVMALTTPPPKRPYSAEMAAVLVVVSCSASSMKRSSGVARRLSCTVTPFTMNRFWYDIAPEIVSAPEGPLGTTPGVSMAVSRRLRASGSFSTNSCFRFVAICAFWPKSEPVSPVTSTVSVTPETESVAFTVVVWPITTRALRLAAAKPDSSTDSVYSPGGRNGTRKSPFSELVAVRTP